MRKSEVRVGGCCFGVPFGCGLVLLLGAGGASLWRFAGPEYFAGAATLVTVFLAATFYGPSLLAFLAGWRER